MPVYSFKGSIQRFKQSKPQALYVMTAFMYVCSTLMIKRI